MKFKTLHVENFGPVSDATVELRAINMLIGEQSIGKSTLAKLITIFTDYISLCNLLRGGESTWESHLKEYNLEIYKDNPYKIVYEMHEGNRYFQVILRPGKIDFSMRDGEKETSDPIKITDQLVRLKPFYHTEELLKKVTADRKKNRDISEILEWFKNSLYIPAERIIDSVLTKVLPALALTKVAISPTLLRFMIELGNAKSEYPMLPIPILGIEFKHEPSEDMIVLNKVGKTSPIPMTAASSGIQSLVPLLLVLHYAINKREFASYVIEEPECNLFPTKQVELLKEILSLVKHPTRILTITTHSPYLLSAMNNLLFAGMLVDKYGDDIRQYVDKIIPEAARLKAEDCSVYSLGSDINGGDYCRSLMDQETGMIDFNSLDGVSEELGAEFEALQKTVINLKSSK